MKKSVTESVIVSFSNINKENPILLVGRKQLNKNPDVINVFHGKEAEELYSRLITKRSEPKED